MVGGGDDSAVLKAERVVCLRAAQLRQRKAGTELDALDGRHAEHRLGNRALHAVEHRRADAGGQARDGAFDHAADAVLRQPRRFDLGAHRVLAAFVDEGKR